MRSVQPETLSDEQLWQLVTERLRFAGPLEAERGHVTRPSAALRKRRSSILRKFAR